MYHLPAENIVSYRWQLRCRWKKFQLWSRYSSLDPLSIYYAVAIYGVLWPWEQDLWSFDLKVSCVVRPVVKPSTSLTWLAIICRRSLL